VQRWDATGFRASVDRAIDEVGSTGATITWTLANHDVYRAVTRYGLTRRDSLLPGVDPMVALMRPRGDVDVELGERRARAALLLLLALSGSVYLYQGEELGLPEVLDLPDDSRQDPIWTRSGGTEYGRDGCRVPLPWTRGGPTFGFSPDDAVAGPGVAAPAGLVRQVRRRRTGRRRPLHPPVQETCKNVS
jgi:alpha-glucosidase